MARISRLGWMAAAALGGTMLARGLQGRKARGPWHLEEVRVTSLDGLQLRAFMRFPGGEGPHPAVLLLHGGRGGSPLRAAVIARTRVAAALLAQGYAVLAVSYRRHGLLDKEVDDAQAAFEFLRAHPRVDADRLAILGNSHGGSIAIAVAPRTTARCVVEYCAVADIPLMVRFLTASRLRSHAPLVREALDDLKRICGGTCDEVPEVYRAISPAYRVWALEVPMMMAHGSHDGLVPVTHAYILRDALEAAEKQYEMHIYPRMPHPFPFQRRPEADDLIGRTVDFLRRWCPA
jgi:dipeptidyl aminopeptidase/acylaminoacyl peptidase